MFELMIRYELIYTENKLNIKKFPPTQSVS